MTTEHSLYVHELGHSRLGTVGTCEYGLAMCLPFVPPEDNLVENEDNLPETCLAANEVDALFDIIEGTDLSYLYVSFPSVAKELNFFFKTDSRISFPPLSSSAIMTFKEQPSSPYSQKIIAQQPEWPYGFSEKRNVRCLVKSRGGQSSPMNTLPSCTLQHNSNILGDNVKLATKSETDMIGAWHIFFLEDFTGRIRF